MPVLEKRIKGLVLDLDNTLYPFPENKDDIFAEASAYAAVEMGIRMAFNDAVIAAHQSFIQHNDEALVFCKKFGLDEKEFHRIKHAYGKKLMLAAISQNPAHIKALKTLNDNYDLRILTHGSQEWAEQLIEHLSFNDVISKDKILGLDNPRIMHRKKDDGPEVFNLVAKIMGLSTEQLASVEDTSGNLIAPHSTGMQTVFVHWGKPLKEKPGYITSQIHDFTHLVP